MKPGVNRYHKMIPVLFYWVAALFGYYNNDFGQIQSDIRAPFSGAANAAMPHCDADADIRRARRVFMCAQAGVAAMRARYLPQLM
jgi:hypothetical protein